MTVARRRCGAALAVCLAGCHADSYGFDTPESVLPDPVDDVYYVSNIQGAPFAKDGNGYIARVDPDGRRMDRHWIQGGRNGVVLHAPMGLALSGDVLWVADIDVVRRFDRTSGAPRGEIAIPGVSFLDDVAVAPDGTVYVSDPGIDADAQPTGTDAIWRIGGDGTPRQLAAGPALGQPHGLVARDSGVFVVSWRDGTFFQIDTAGRRTDLGKAPTAQLDGLVRVEGKDVPGGFYATSRAGRCLYRFSLAGDCTALPGSFDQPADCGYDERRRRIVVPLFGKGELAIVPLTTH